MFDETLGESIIYVSKTDGESNMIAQRIFQCNQESELSDFLKYNGNYVDTP
jgi:hypothetical protein